MFELLKNASDEEKLNELITKDDTFTRVDVETVAAINLFVGTDIKYDEKEEVVNMCKAWDDHKSLAFRRACREECSRVVFLKFIFQYRRETILQKEVPRRLRCRLMNLKKR